MLLYAYNYFSLTWREYSLNSCPAPRVWVLYNLIHKLWYTLFQKKWKWTLFRNNNCGARVDNLFNQRHAPGNKTIDMYFDFLQNATDSALNYSHREQPCIHLRVQIFQQHGAPSHYSRKVRNSLNETFPDKEL